MLLPRPIPRPRRPGNARHRLAGSWSPHATLPATADVPNHLLEPALKYVLYWTGDAFQAWAGKAIGTVRELKPKLPPHSDLFRKDEAKERLRADGLTQSTIVARLTSAAKAMEFVGK